MRTDNGMDVAAAEIHGHMGPQAFSAMFVYDVHDPLALQIVFPTGTGGTTWCFARDLVVEAIQTGEEAGLADVKIEVLNPGEISFKFSSDGEATVHFSLPEVLAFVTVTGQFVPFGEENIDADLDAFLDSLLES